jgi:hypothetical protein
MSLIQSPAGASAPLCTRRLEFSVVKDTETLALVRTRTHTLVHARKLARVRTRVQCVRAGVEAWARDPRTPDRLGRGIADALSSRG